MGGLETIENMMLRFAEQYAKEVEVDVVRRRTAVLAGLGAADYVTL
jgi:hypothetical protein